MRRGGTTEARPAQRAPPSSAGRSRRRASAAPFQPEPQPLEPEAVSAAIVQVLRGLAQVADECSEVSTPHEGVRARMGDVLAGVRGSSSTGSAASPAYRTVNTRDVAATIQGVPTADFAGSGFQGDHLMGDPGRLPVGGRLGAG